MTYINKCPYCGSGLKDNVTPISVGLLYSQKDYFEFGPFGSLKIVKEFDLMKMEYACGSTDRAPFSGSDDTDISFYFVSNKCMELRQASIDKQKEDLEFMKKYNLWKKKRKIKQLQEKAKSNGKILLHPTFKDSNKDK